MSNAQPLRLGMFVMPIHDPAKPLAQCIDEDLELAVQCEEFGFHDFWVGEHHSSSVENIVMPEIFLAKSARPDGAHSHRTGTGLPAVPPSGPRGGAAGVSGSHVARPAQCLFRTGSNPDRHGGLRGAPERNGSACRRIDRHDHAIVDGRGADRYRRAVLEREDERQLEPQVRRRTSPQTIPAAAPADLCPEYQSRVCLG